MQIKNDAHGSGLVVADEQALQDFASLVRVSDVLESLGRILACR